jgi:hypothetical protein
MLIPKEEYYNKLQKILNLDNETLDKFILDEKFFYDFIKNLNFDKEDTFLIEKMVKIAISVKNLTIRSLS